MLTHLFENARLTGVAAVIAATIILFQFQDLFPFNQLLVWWFCIVGINLSRVIFAVFFLKKEISDAKKEQRWNRLFMVGLTLSSATWTYAAIMFFPADSFYHQSVYLMIFLGVTAGGTFTLSSSFMCVMLHSPVISTGVAFSFFNLFLNESWLTAIGSIFYILIYNMMLLVTASRHRIVLVRQTHLQIANERLIKRLRLDREQAVSENKAKSTFLATMSHEIRTPLNGLFGMIQVLREELQEPSHRADVETMYRSAKSLLTILNDILDFSKISAGRMELEHISFNWMDLLGEVAELIRGNVNAKGLDFKLQVTPHAITQVKGDMLRLRQVITNLLDNSIKFTQSGEIGLSAWGEPLDEHRFSLNIEVKDTGIGISEEAQKSMFSRFSQADSSTTRKYGGTGLGLAISQKLVEMMHGKISCVSSVNEGSIFSFNVVFEIATPLVDSDLYSEPGHSVRHDLQTSTQSLRRVVVVDDDVVGRKVARQLLKRLGYDCETLESGVKALQEFPQKQWDLMFLDMQMPGIDGPETAKTIRKMETMQSTNSHRMHIVACTANLSKEDRDHCLDAGMDDYIGKPILLEELQDVMHRYEGQLTPVSDEVQYKR